MQFDSSLVGCSCKGGKSLNDFYFGTFTGRSPSDGEASLAMKGLKGGGGGGGAYLRVLPMDDQMFAMKGSRSLDIRF